MRKRFVTAVLAAAIGSVSALGATAAHADQPTYVCTNIQPTAYPDLRNFLTHSKTIAIAAEATGIYDCTGV